jgi:hypothetical protein
MNQNFTDAQTVAFVTGQAYKINATVLAAQYPDFDFGRFVYVDSSGPEWTPGTWTWTSDMSGAAKWQSGYAKDIPYADVSQNYQLKTHHLAAVGYQWNIEEVNTTIRIAGQGLDTRRAAAARQAYMQFMYALTLSGDTEKRIGGLINYTGITPTPVPDDGTGGVRYWVSSTGVGTKTPAQIVRDINNAIGGTNNLTFNIAPADTIMLPQNAYNYIAGTPYSATTMETILSFIQRSNVYTIQTGRPLTIRALRELNTAATNTTSPTSAGMGRMVVYRNDPNTVKLHLPMPHKFLPVYQDGPLNFMVPGIFRTGGVEILDPVTFAYWDGVSQ